ncbi:Lrp/AsnC family transcriptional regulator [Spongiibacter sp.]|uniref:Lrp/AsnC family transcriptional regulator n=1 Tax=Spongiibacter sp. TaxID=2024860 RepID=UPI00356B45F9
MKLSRSERDILTQLQANGRISNVELAERVGLSESPCFRRVKQLEESGLIRGYAAVVDQRKLGMEVTAFVQVTMAQQSDTDTQKFIACVQAEEHIMECYAMSGSHDYLMKVVARNIDHFSELAMRRILKFPGVKNVESSFNLQEVKHSRVLPIN